MDFKDLAAKRRSIRKFSERKIEQDKIDSLIRTTLMAPSSKNSRTTRIAWSDDPEVMQVISGMRTTGSAFVSAAPLVFFIMGDDSQTDLWRENASISATMLQFAAEDMGLGSCWVQVSGRMLSDDDPQGKTAEQFLKENIPSLPDHKIMCVVAVGYPSSEVKPREHKVDTDKVFRIP